MTDKSKVIIMDDDIDYANFIFDVASSLGLNCIITTNPNDFMNLFNSEISLVFLDLNIPKINGLDLLRFIESKKGKCDIILMSGVEDRILEAAEAFAQSIKLSIVGRFQKTIRLAELEGLLHQLALNHHKIDTTTPVEKPKSEFIVTKESLTQAMQNDEFVVYYQPKIDIATRGFYGVEALVRWSHNQKLIFPDEFINQAESFGLIDDLTWVIIKKAIKEIGDLQNKVQLPFKLALNLSSETLKDLELPNKFLNVIQQSGFSPEKIIFEITESGLINELSSALEIFTRLRLNKVQLSIDDFGTGYAMMQQLKIIPANEIKIDKSFVQNMFIEKSAAVTVKKVIELGHELGMKVVAEGVETKEQLRFLQINNCDIAQGYLFSKPISITDLHLWIDNKYGF